MTPAETAPRPACAFGWWILAAAVLLALRKPWALHTPQFWAEDGSIFMLQNEQLGLAALLQPYNGYLHPLPRLVAWIASRTADVAWWPAIYNGCAYAITVGLFFRLASPRFALPAKPALLLAFPLVVGTGEALLNMTNVQWIASFFLLAHLFLSRPRSAVQRVADLGLLLLVGLNGPFSILYTPLFAWRAWRERHADVIAACAVMAGCAVIQGLFVLRLGAALESTTEPFRPLMGVSIWGSRLVTWSFFGPAAVRALPVWLHAVAGGGFILALLAWALRPDPLRRVRGLLVAAFVLVTIACAYRVRADTWTDDSLVNGDRYFYISRVLFLWLLILEWQATPRAIAWTARGLAALGTALHVPHFVIPDPPDYRWESHCDPIRRGEPANISTLPEGYWIEYPGRPKPP